MEKERVIIMGIPFDKVTLESVLTLLLEKLADDSTRGFFVATPNPEMLLTARKNHAFKEILQKTHLNIPDGTGIIWAAKRNGTPLPERVTGTDLMQTLCRKVTPDTRVFLLGAGHGIAEKAAHKLKEQKHINIVGTYAGSASPHDDLNLQKIINDARPDMLFVAFGAPAQELWLARNLPHLFTVKVAMGVGGAFDFIAGVRSRAPAWMRRVGLEWLYRLFQQPERIVRIFNATVRFPATILFGKK
jgi:N-acetylglucosaminyldiphosphoundecaprenol N-acetyl-beta-D-mannosaminyltransferase